MCSAGIVIDDSVAVDRFFLEKRENLDILHNKGLMKVINKTEGNKKTLKNPQVAIGCGM